MIRICCKEEESKSKLKIERLENGRKPDTVKFIEKEAYCWRFDSGIIRMIADAIQG